MKSPVNAQLASSNERLPPTLANSTHVGSDDRIPECQTQTRPGAAKGNDDGSFQYPPSQSAEERDMKALRKLMTSALVLGCATVVAASPAIAWQPNKPIDFIIMAGKGGGADKMARLMQGIVEKESLA
ncbi:MAG: hypothetical protein VX110_06330, partial [Pseudomonadota bacterium]|nr:hypothetical protein [Pseudomonadota bacterium]